MVQAISKLQMLVQQPVKCTQFACTRAFTPQLPTATKFIFKSAKFYVNKPQITTMGLKMHTHNGINRKLG
jgi:hypothetical protein